MTESCGLAQKECTACTPKTPYLTWPHIKRLLAEVPLWKYEQLVRGAVLVRHRRFRTFAGALTFVNEVAAIAIAEGHHPDITIENFNQVILIMTTHAIHGLSENDFIMAAKIDRIS